MRRSIFLFIVLTVLFFASLLFAGNSRSSSADTSFDSNHEGIKVFFFYGEGCPHCARVESFIDEMQQAHDLNVQRFEVYGNRKDLMLLEDYFENHNVPSGRRGVPAVFTSNSCLVGDDSILDGFEELISSSSRSSERAGAVGKGVDEALNAEEGFDCLSLLSITVAALVDSVNPCSMAILFFLLAGLLLLRKRERALKVGLAFTLSVFSANLLFGLGIFTTVAISGFSSFFKVAAGLIAISTGFLLIKDCFFYGRGGFTLEVPRSLRPYLKRKLSKAFFGKSSGPLAAFLIGFLVSSFEIPCTGGPYFYVLARMADEATRMQTAPMLLYYNLIFVTPLILITILLYFNSIHVEKARQWKDKNKPLISLARGLPMIAIGLVTIPTSQIIQALTLVLNVYRALAIPAMVLTASYIIYRAFSKVKNWERVTTTILLATPLILSSMISTAYPGWDKIHDQTGLDHKKSKVYIFPRRVAYPKLDVGETFTVDVRIDNVDDLYAYEFKLNYNLEVLEYVGISSSFLNEPTFKFKKAYAESGMVWLATSSMYPAQSKTEGGVLATITFQVKGIGESTLDLYNTKLLNSDVKRIDHTVKDGYFKNGKDEDEFEIEMFKYTYTEQSSVAQTDIEFTGVETFSIESFTDVGPLSNGGIEVCDKIDNNNNGHVDEPDVCLSGDVDHVINETNYYNVGLEDLTITGQAYGSKAGEERYDDTCLRLVDDPEYPIDWFCDVYGPGKTTDGLVNVFDLAWIGKNYGNEHLAGCVDVTVKFNNDDPIEGADVSVVGSGESIGTTNSTGQTTRCCVFDTPGPYQVKVKAMKDGSQVGEDTPLDVDVKGDGSADIVQTCTDADEDTYAIEGGICGEIDCDDTDPDINPEATEVCNGIDENCDDVPDEGSTCDGCVKATVVGVGAGFIVVIDRCETPGEWWLGVTNEVGVAVGCGIVPEGDHYADALYSDESCYGGESWFSVDSYGTGTVNIYSGSCTSWC